LFAALTLKALILQQRDNPITVLPGISLLSLTSGLTIFLAECSLCVAVVSFVTAFPSKALTSCYFATVSGFRIILQWLEDQNHQGSNSRFDDLRDLLSREKNLLLIG